MGDVSSIRHASYYYLLYRRRTNIGTNKEQRQGLFGLVEALINIKHGKCIVNVKVYRQTAVNEQLWTVDLRIC